MSAWVICGPSELYHLKVRYRVYSGRRMRDWRAQKNPARGRIFSFLGSGGPLWALLAHNSKAPLATRQKCPDR